MLAPSLNFYRDRFRLQWILPVTREGPEGGCNYYLLLPQDHELLARYEMRPILDDCISGLALGRPGH